MLCSWQGLSGLCWVRRLQFPKTGQKPGGVELWAVKGPVGPPPPQPAILAHPADTADVPPTPSSPGKTVTQSLSRLFPLGNYTALSLSELLPHYSWGGGQSRPLCLLLLRGPPGWC